MLTLKNLDDFHEWPVKHRHWMFEVVEDEAHNIWVRTQDVRAFWEKFPPDRDLKATHSSALLYAKDTKSLYIAQRAMRLLLQRAKSHSFYPEVLKFLDWFERNVSRVAEGKRTGVRLTQINTHRNAQEQRVHLGPLRPGLASPQMEDSTLQLSQEERWALERLEENIPRVFHADASVRHTSWREWLGQGLPAVRDALGDMWRGHANLWVTYALVAIVAALPAALLRAFVPASSEEWPAAITRLLWGHMLVAVLSLVLAAGIFLVLTRCTRNAMRIVAMRWIALGAYCVALSMMPGLMVRNVDVGLLDAWWGLVSGSEQPVEVRADPHLGRIVLRGDVGFGSSAALEKVLLANRQLTLIELESPGGYVVEGFGMAELIARYGLDTVALGDCASACTLLFAAGKVRYLGPSAELGFHRSGTKYGPVGEGWSATDHAVADYYARRGVQQSFIHKALTPSIRELWVAPHGEQYAAGYASAPWSERKAGY